MEDYIGKVCPFCKTEIKEGEEVKICPACGVSHHTSCWEENKGCATFGCSRQNCENQGINVTDVCSNCGATLGDGQMFCPECGTPIVKVKKNVCGKCRAELQDGQKFCPKCGQKVGFVVDGSVNSAILQFNADINKTNEKKKKIQIIIGIVAGVVVLVGVLIFVFGSGSKTDFNKMYSEIAGESWCTIALDGSYIKFDTNPRDKDLDDFTSIDYATLMDATYKIEEVNEELGFSSALIEKMNTTNALQGRQTESNEKYTVTWSYHPDNGLEVMYEVND